MRYLLIFFLCLFILPSCSRQEDPAVAQMKLRKMQSRTFLGCESRVVAKEVIQLLQDEGYMVKNVNTDIGLITGELNTNIESFGSKFWAYVFRGRNARWKKHSVVEITANISEGDNQSKIRVNYLVRIYDNLGRVVDVHQILEDEVYVNFFNQIQQGLLKSQAS